MRWPRSRSRNKFNAVKTNGFGSKLESAVHDILKLRELNGEIKNIEMQPQVYLTRASIGYKPDFKYVDVKTGESVWVEAKGVEVGEWRLKKKLWRFYGPGLLQIYRGDYRRPRLDEELVPNRKMLTCPGCGVPVADAG